MRVIILTIILFLAHSSFVEDSCNITFYEKGVLRSDGLMEEGWVNVSLPLESEYGHVWGSNEKYSGDGTLTLHISDTSYFSYEVEVNVTTHARTPYSQPLNGDYLSPTDHIPVNEHYRDLAENITKYATSDEEKIFAVARWVHDYITYDPEYADVNMGSDEVLRVGRGVCTEYTNLFTSLMRSLGYPTRVVMGYALSDQWELHSWAEVYVDGKWVPVDPTWMEVGRLDATHVPFRFSDDTVMETTLYILHSGHDIDRDVRSGVSYYECSSVDRGVDIHIYPSVLRSGEWALLFVNLTTDTEEAIPVEVEPCSSEEDLLYFYVSEGNYLLRPGANTIVFPFRVSPFLDAGYVYTCPIVVYYGYGSKEYDVEIIGNNGRDNRADLHVSLQGDYIVANTSCKECVIMYEGRIGTNFSRSLSDLIVVFGDGKVNYALLDGDRFVVVAPPITVSSDAEDEREDVCLGALLLIMFIGVMR